MIYTLFCEMSHNYLFIFLHMIKYKYGGNEKEDRVWDFRK